MINAETLKKLIKKREKEFRQAFNFVYIFAYIFVYVYIAMACGLIVSSDYFWVNFILMLTVFGAALAIFRSCSAAFCFSSGFALFIYYLNEYVYFSRHTCIQFRDVYCISDALAVANHYKLPFSLEIILNIVLVVGLDILMFFSESKLRRLDMLPRKVFFAATGGGLAALSLIIAVFLPVQPLNFDVNGFTKKYGLPYALYCEFRQSSTQPPENYSAAAVLKLKEKYSADEITSEDTERLNIIVVMNEALTDYSFLGETKLMSDPLARIHALAEEKNCKMGYAMVSCYGGMTCNTEFEFLTGASFAFLPYGSIPFLQYMHRGVQSVGRDFNALGYETLALHPYYAAEWRRTQNYGLLGFDRFISGEEFAKDYEFEEGGNITDKHLSGVNFGDSLEYVRGFVSDAECYRKIMFELEEANTRGNSVFTFCVTMQNHGGYGNASDDFFPDVYYSGTDNEDNYRESCDYINEYFTLSSVSDKAFCDFIEKVREYPEKTIVVIFGDHQPGIEAAALLTNGDECVFPTEAWNFVVPYVLWSNFDMEWEVADMISINYLSAIIKRNAGLSLTCWDKIRLSAYESYPVLTQDFAVNFEGEFTSRNEAEKDSVLLDYILAQYAMLFNDF